MKLQYLRDARPPLVRLYDFEAADAMQLKELFDRLANGSRADIPLHQQKGIEPVDGCQLTLRIGKRNIGIIQQAPFEFQCDLTPGRWADVASFTEPFCEAAKANTYQWLNEDGEISLLLSLDGRW